MKGKILGISALFACSLTVVFASSMSTKASNNGELNIASAGITAMLDKYYENSTEETADIMALLTDTVAQSKEENVTEATTEAETEKATKKPEKETKKKTRKSRKSRQKKKLIITIQLQFLRFIIM